MFWGLIMEPNKRYTQVVEKPFHISQAAMDISTGDNDPCQVMIVVDGKNFLVCTLQKNKCIQVPLDLYFKAGDSVAFLTNGKCNVHLTGYLDPEFEEEPSDDEEEEEEDEEEAPTLVPAKGKRKLENSNDASSSKKKKTDKKAVAAENSDSDDDADDEDQLRKLLDGEDVDTDEDDETFKVNTSAEADSDDEEDSEEEAEEEEEDSDNEEKDSSKADSTLDSSKGDVDMSKLSKSARRRLKKKLAQQNKQPQVNGVDRSKKEKGDAPQQKGEKKKQDSKKEIDTKEKSGDKKEKKALSGGVFIEDMKVGEGPAAKPGKTIMVYYEGRLKQNNKMFDNCKKGAGFKFRLGAKEVISGWDIGIAGMKVGGKRKIICPPGMAYGAKGSPPVIPPNSTLVFDVELKEVK
ncbi:46 kDa FK506-binding nuclear protein isoform X2 [Hyposmocoma kahamanoa]|uniref:46 kDa FK506-binding nuclear protein isoform X2 n=1 Tax=Hyposmocoma kahamanoa TaxID=1477025 RepID=UPI000E6D83D8|nr:46 kDa FK506-binding nuclear protein isoform X2 [Hyposmocoma kahamanoa]